MQSQETIQSLLSKALIISICADIWSKPGMTALLLCVTAHFFTPYSDQHHSICIALRRFPSPHTGVRIAELLQRIVAEWEIPCNKLFRVSTGNRSNMVAAFKANNNNEDDIAESDGDEALHLKTATNYSRR